MEFLRNGLILGVIFSIVSMVVFGRSVTNMFPAPTIIPFQPFMARFLFGMLIDGALPVSVILAVRYALVLHSRNIPC
jgi:hypothetical protein